MDISKDHLFAHLSKIIGPKHHDDEEAEARLLDTEKYIVNELSSYGWKPELQEFSFDEMTTAWGRVRKNRYGTNIIAEKPGKSDKVLIIATHHDTVPGSPGADDNGTGVAALLEIARILINIETTYTIRIISFDLEEAGLIGSEYYVQQLSKEEQKRIDGMIMLEMLGYYSEEEQSLPEGFGFLYRKEIRRISKGGSLRENFLVCVFRRDAIHIAKAFKATNNEENLEVALIRDAVDLPIIGKVLEFFIPSLQNLLRSDHTPFWFRNIPAVMITDTANFRNSNYHLPSDTIDTINPEKFTEATTRVLDSIRYLDKVLKKEMN